MIPNTSSGSAPSYGWVGPSHRQIVLEVWLIPRLNPNSRLGDQGRGSQPTVPRAGRATRPPGTGAGNGRIDRVTVHRTSAPGGNSAASRRCSDTMGSRSTCARLCRPVVAARQLTGSRNYCDTSPGHSTRSRQILCRSQHTLRSARDREMSGFHSPIPGMTSGPGGRPVRQRQPAALDDRPDLLGEGLTHFVVVTSLES
jgi:hypothetical protein